MVRCKVATNGNVVHTRRAVVGMLGIGSNSQGLGHRVKIRKQLPEIYKDGQLNVQGY